MSIPPIHGRFVGTRRRVLAACLALAGGALLLIAPGRWPGAPSAGDRLDDRAFWHIFSEFSEPGGYFRSDNLVSNERTLQYVIPELTRRKLGSGAYIGVGPEQNFTYLAAVRPRIAFIVDVRRQNALLHLLYKAIIELSPDRAAFLSRLFSRPRPPGLGRDASAPDLVEAFGAVAPSESLFRENVKAALAHLTGRHGFPLAPDDARTIETVYGSFFTDGPGITYSFGRGNRWRRFPSYAELVVAGDERGDRHGFLVDDDRFQALRRLHVNNLVIPVVGDFGGGKALKAVAGYLRGRRIPVTVFYTSNVEQYLFRSGTWRAFMANVAILPVDPGSVIIRAAFRGMAPPPINGGRLDSTLLDPIPDLLAAVAADRVQSYADLIARSR